MAKAEDRIPSSSVYWTAEADGEPAFNPLVIIVGVLILVISCIVSVYFVLREDKRGRARHQRWEQQQQPPDDSQDEARPQAARAGRTGADRIRQRLRRRRNAAAPDDDAGPSAADGDDAGSSEEEEEGDEAGTTRKEKKRAARERARQEREDAQEARLSKKNLYEDRRSKKAAEREAQEAAQQAEIEAAEEAQRRADEAEAAKWADLISVEKEGTGEADVQEENQGLLGAFIDYIKERKTVVLDELAAEFGLRTQDVINRVQGLEAMGRLTGVMDDRGKFIYISPEEMKAVADFIKGRGRVAIGELAAKSATMIDLEPRAVAVPEGALPDLDFSEFEDPARPMAEQHAPAVEVSA